MNILTRIILQTKKPTGLPGSIIARIMNRAHDKLTNWGLKFVNIKDDFIILDIGCGAGKTINKLVKMVKNGKVYGIDYSDVSVKLSSQINSSYINQHKVEIQKGSVSSLPFSDNTFDLITAIETHFFWPDLENDMKEVLRVLKPNGKLLIISEMYKNNNKKWIEKLNIDKLLKNQTKEEFSQLFINAGYDDVNIYEDSTKVWICGVGTKK